MKKIKDLLTDESKWCQGAAARDANFTPVKPHDPGAVRWCLVGAARFVYQHDAEADYSATRRIIDELSIDLPVSVWNDAPERTFADVRALIEKLDV